MSYNASRWLIYLCSKKLTGQCYRQSIFTLAIAIPEELVSKFATFTKVCNHFAIFHELVLLLKVSD